MMVIILCIPGGSDFQQLQVHLIFTSAGKQCVHINITDDDVLEITERFRVELFFQNNPNVIFEGQRLQVNIEDNDGKSALVFLSG